MEKGLFFDRIDMAGDNPAVYQGIQYAVLIFPDVAQSATTLFYNAPMGAKVASNFLVFQRLI
jgi:hypothetical protein